MATVKTPDQADVDRKRRLKLGELRIELLPASDHPPVYAAALRAELNAFRNSLRRAGIVHLQRAKTFDAEDARGHQPAVVTIQTLGPPEINAITAAVGGWLAGRASRKARVKFGDVEAEARTPMEAEQLLRTAAQYRSSLEKANKEE